MVGILFLNSIMAFGLQKYHKCIYVVSFNCKNDKGGSNDDLEVALHIILVICIRN